MPVDPNFVLITNNYWTTNVLPGVQVFKTFNGANAYVPVGDADYVAWLAEGHNTVTIPTEAELWQLFDDYNQNSYRKSARTFSQANGPITLANPLASYLGLTITNFAAANHHVILPRMRGPGSIPIGQTIEIVNNGSAFLLLYAQDNTTLVGTLAYGDKINLTLLDNSTDNGTFKAVLNSGATSTECAHAVVSDHLNPTTMRFAGLGHITLTDAPLSGQFTGVNVSRPMGVVDIDISVVGLNGRDQAGAFPAGSTVFFYAMFDPLNVTNTYLTSGLASLNGPDNGGPTIKPAGYTYWATLTALVLDGAGNVPLVKTHDEWVYYDTATVILAAGAANGATPVTPVVLAGVAGGVPLGTREVLLEVLFTDAVAGSAAVFGHVSGAVSFISQTAFAGEVCVTHPTTFITFNGLNVFYNNITVNGRTTIKVRGYRVATGR